MHAFKNLNINRSTTVPQKKNNQTAISLSIILGPRDLSQTSNDSILLRTTYGSLLDSSVCRDKSFPVLATEIYRRMWTLNCLREERRNRLMAREDTSESMSLIFKFYSHVRCALRFIKHTWALKMQGLVP